MRPCWFPALLLLACAEDNGLGPGSASDASLAPDQPNVQDAALLDAAPSTPDQPASCDPVRPDHVETCGLSHGVSNKNPKATEPVVVRLHTQAAAVEQVRVRWWTGVAREQELRLQKTVSGVDTFEAPLPPSAKPIYYRFTLKDGSATLYLTSGGPREAPPSGEDDLAIAPSRSAKTLHYATDFQSPRIHFRSDPAGPYTNKAMTAEGKAGAGVTGIGSADKELLFHIKDGATGDEDHPPGGGDYRLAPDVDEAWLEKGTLYDVPPETLALGLIDAHTHPYNRLGSAWVYDPKPLTTLAPKQGITHVLTMASGKATAQRSLLTTLHKAHRWVVPLAWVWPESHTVAEIEDLLVNHAFRGLKFHPTASAYPADGPLMDKFLVLAAKHRVPVQIHSATDDNAKVSRVVALAKRHPTVSILMIHTELGAIDKTAALGQIKDRPNIYAETSWTNPESILQAMKMLDSSRVIFGTDSTVDGYEQFNNKSTADPQGQYVYSIPAIIAQVKAKAHPEAYANWARRNVIRLYGLRFRPDPDLYDTDGDGQPDAADPDDDNDGTPDGSDPAPRSP